MAAGAILLSSAVAALQASMAFNHHFDDQGAKYDETGKAALDKMLADTRAKVAAWSQDAAKP